MGRLLVRNCLSGSKNHARWKDKKIYVANPYFVVCNLYQKLIKMIKQSTENLVYQVCKNVVFRVRKWNVEKGGRKEEKNIVL